MRRNFPHLGFDPTPGDVEQSRVLARQIGNLAAELNRTVSELSKIDSTGWTGKAAIAFRQHVDHDVQPLIVKADNSFNHASSALNKWASQLEGFQAEADALEREAATKQATLDGANKALNAAGGPPPVISVPSSSPSGTDHVQQQRQKQHAATEASSALDSVRSRAHELHDRYMRAAGAVGRSLEKAGHIAPAKPGFFHNLVNDVEHSWDATTHWLKTHADLIAHIGDMLSCLSSVLGVLAIITAPFEPLGAIFAVGAMVASGAALLTQGLAKAEGAKVSWTDIAMDAVGLIPGIKGATMGAELAKGTDAVARAAKLGEGYRGVTGMGKTFLLFGSAKAFPLVKAGKGASRTALAVEGAYQNVRMGQWLGTKGLNLATKLPIIKSAELINPMSKAGRSLDAGIKGALAARKIDGVLKKDFGIGGHAPAAAS